MADRQRYGNGNENRDEAGVICTLSDGSVIHVSGYTKAALEVVAAYCDRHDLAVATISTPRTVLADLRMRSTALNRLGNASRPTPELALLGQIGRGDLAQA